MLWSIEKGKESEGIEHRPTNKRFGFITGKEVLLNLNPIQQFLQVGTRQQY